MDEFDIDVVPLKHEAPGERGSLSSPTQVRSPLATRLGPRERLLRTSGILGVLLLALVVLVAVTPGARSAVVGAVLGPTPTATTALLDGNDHFAVEDPVPWGTLLIDGRPGPKVTPVQPATQTSPPQLITFGLARGRHQLEYRADPFPVLRCTLSVPAAPRDTCPIDPQVIDLLVSDGPYTRLLDLRGTADRLPAAQANALADATQRVLDAAAAEGQGVLAPGDHYLGADAQVTVAGERLTAEPTYTLSRDLQPAPDGHCAILCSDAVPWAQTSADEWLLNAYADISWRYRGADGQVVLADGPPGPPAARQAGSVQVGVRRVDGSWQVRLNPANPAFPAEPPVRDPLTCVIGAHYLDVLRASPDQTTISLTDHAYLWLGSSSPPELGCVFGGGRTFDDRGNLTGAVALVLYRFGALLAVNDEAHRVFPHIPLASAHERALAQAAWPPPTGSTSPGG
jgi:hypothetical protein